MKKSLEQRTRLLPSPTLPFPYPTLLNPDLQVTKITPNQFTLGQQRIQRSDLWAGVTWFKPLVGHYVWLSSFDESLRSIRRVTVDSFMAHLASSR